MSWYESAYGHIQQFYLEQLELGETDKVKIGKMIDDSYPFGERKRFPYKMWLKARRELFSKFGLHDLTKVKINSNDLFSYQEKFNSKKHFKA